MSLCYYVKNHDEFENTIEMFHSVLDKKSTKKAISSECITGTRGLIRKIRSKEGYISNAVRMYLTNCMDAGTTSPCEAQNRVMKKGPCGINSNMNLETAVEKTTTHLNHRLKKSHNDDIHTLNKKSLFSRSITKNHITLKGQCLADKNFDARNSMKGK